MKKATIAGLAACAMCCGSTAWADNGFELVHTMPFGRPSAMTVVGDLGVYGITNGIMLVDVSDPASPVKLSRLSIPGYVNAIVVAGDRAYIAAGAAGVAEVDLADPAYPILVDMVDTPGWAWDVAVSGSWLFVADGYGGCRSINLTGSGVLGSVVNVPNARRVATDLQLAVVIGTPDLWVIDVSDPTNMIATATATTPAGAWDLEVDAARTYIAGSSAGLLILDLVDPVNPVQLGAFVPSGAVLAVDFSNDLVWLTNDDYPGFRGVRAVDVSDPAHPVEIGKIDLGMYYYDICASGDGVFLGPAFESPVLDVSDPIQPMLSWFVTVTDYAREIVVVGDLALVGVGHANQFNGIDIIDFSDPSAPRDLAMLTVQGLIVGFAVDGATLVLVDTSERLHVYDISTPSAPVETGACDLPEPARGVTISGEFVVLSDRLGVRVFDIGEPGAPVEVSFMRPSERLPTALWTVGDYVYGRYLISGFEYMSGGFYIVDVSDPLNPIEQLYVVAGYPNEFVRVGERAYLLAMSSNAVRTTVAVGILDISKNGNPIGMGSVPLCSGYDIGYATSLAVTGNRLVASCDDQVSFVRPDYLDWPVRIDLGRTWIESAATVGHFLVMADDNSGLLVLLDEEVLVDGFESGDTNAWQ